MFYLLSIHSQPCQSYFSVLKQDENTEHMLCIPSIHRSKVYLKKKKAWTKQTSKNKQQKHTQKKASFLFSYHIFSLFIHTPQYHHVALKHNHLIKTSHSQHIKLSNSDCKHMILPLFVFNIIPETMDQPKDNIETCRKINWPYRKWSTGRNLAVYVSYNCWHLNLKSFNSWHMNLKSCNCWHLNFSMRLHSCLWSYDPWVLQELQGGKKEMHRRLGCFWVNCFLPSHFSEFKTFAFKQLKCPCGSELNGFPTV